MGPSQRYAMQLTAVLGLIMELAISIVVPVTSAGGGGTILARRIASYELLDGAGSSVIGGSAIRSDYALHVKGSRKHYSRSLFGNSLSWARGDERVIYIETATRKAIGKQGP